ncbi:MAG: peptidase U62, partial [bacterium]|nr:peptidase U62 [bacterium]
PVSRQGNLMVESTKSVPYKKLREMLVKECKKQGIPYGLMFDDIAGGFTFTGRTMPNSFNVTPITVYRIYVDGRPDELVRGVDLIGTPLTSFSRIIACGETRDVFNGYCGAESGRVPVSAVSPPILTTQIEVQKKYKASAKPPVLPPPKRRSK